MNNQVSQTNDESKKPRITKRMRRERLMSDLCDQAERLIRLEEPEIHFQPLNDVRDDALTAIMELKSLDNRADDFETKCHSICIALERAFDEAAGILAGYADDFDRALLVASDQTFGFSSSQDALRRIHAETAASASPTAESIDITQGNQDTAPPDATATSVQPS